MPLAISCGVTMNFRIFSFSSASFSANMTLPETQSLFDKISKLEAKLGKTLAFYELETGALVYKKPKMIKSPLLRAYKHALERLRRQVAHQLSEVEE